MWVVLVALFDDDVLFEPEKQVWHGLATDTATDGGGEDCTNALFFTGFLCSALATGIPAVIIMVAIPMFICKPELAKELLLLRQRMG